MMHIRLLTLTVLVVATLMAGCATTGSSGNQVSATIFDTHRRVVKLEKTLDDSINKLNETTAELSAQVSSSDQETRRLRTMVEENQVKLDALERNLNEFKSVVYRQYGLTSSDSAFSTGGIEVQNQPVVIEPPAGTATTPTAPNVPVVTTPTPTTSPAASPVETQPTAPVATSEPVVDPQVFYTKAQTTFVNEDYPTALRQFDEFLQRFPTSQMAPNAIFWKARCFQKMEKYAEAIQVFEQLKTSYPADNKIPFAMHNQAVCYANLGKRQDAEKLLQSVIDNYPVSPAAQQAESTLNKLRNGA